MKRSLEDGFFPADGLHYLSFLEALHENLQPDWYLEIGTQTGASLKLSRAKSVSVDPVYKLRHEIIGNKPEFFAFQETSDAFFEADRLSKLGAKIDMAFLDGMHLFEYLLRDFIGTERSCAKDGIIVLHDCLPWNSSMARRARGQAETSSWTGDVWKMVPVLQKYRPDLDLDVVDAAPTGLVIVSNLNPDSSILSESYNAILTDFLDIEFEDYGTAKYFSSLDIESAKNSKWLSAFPRELSDDWQSKPEISIKLAAPNRAKMLTWGDYHFARGLAREFSRLGHKTTIAAQENWYLDNAPRGIDLVIRGRAQFTRQAERKCLFWCISKGMRDMNYQNADHVFWASKTEFEKASKERGANISTLLPQAFDANLMKLGKEKERAGIVFVGRNRTVNERKAVLFAKETVEDLRIWGPGWRGSEYDEFVVSDWVDNSELPLIYQSAEIVLNDHTEVMKNRGLLSNRVFDTLACGAIPVSEDVGWLPEEIAEFVYVFDDKDSFKKAIAAARSETEAKRAKRRALANSLVCTHSFEARAKTILSFAVEA
ncbi:MAG: glycosyltransferase [Paracoccaceae bacterium]